jgi:hypothetical protein
MIERIRQYWHRDPFFFAAVLAVAVGFLCWAAPTSPGVGYYSGSGLGDGGCEGHGLSLLVVEIQVSCVTTYDGIEYSIGSSSSYGWFLLERLPAIVFFFALGAFLFFLGNRQGRR